MSKIEASSNGGAQVMETLDKGLEMAGSAIGTAIGGPLGAMLGKGIGDLLGDLFKSLGDLIAGAAAHGDQPVQTTYPMTAKTETQGPVLTADAQKKLQDLETEQKHLGALMTHYERAEVGNHVIGGKDGRLALSDLETIAREGGVDQELFEAAKYYAQNPSKFDAISSPGYAAAPGLPPPERLGTANSLTSRYQELNRLIADTKSGAPAPTPSAFVPGMGNLCLPATPAPTAPAPTASTPSSDAPRVQPTITKDTQLEKVEPEGPKKIESKKSDGSIYSKLNDTDWRYDKNKTALENSVDRMQASQLEYDEMLEMALEDGKLSNEESYVLQEKSQRTQLMFTMVTNMSRLLHDMSMAAVNHIR